jgi:multidrug efflux pump subunit AcrA (membrane-fusion protein)
MSQPQPSDAGSGQGIVRGSRVLRPGARRRLLLCITIVVVFAGLLAGAYFLPRPQDTSYVLRSYTSGTVTRKDLSQILQLPGTIGFSRIASLVSPAAGTVSVIRAQPGDDVAAGQLIASLSSDTAERALRDDTAALDDQRRLRDHLMGTHALDTASGQRTIDMAELRLERATTSLSNTQALFAAGMARRPT